MYSNWIQYGAICMLVFSILIWIHPSTHAQTTDELLRQMQQQIRDLQQRVTELEAQNAQLKNSQIKQQQPSNEKINTSTAENIITPSQNTGVSPHGSMFDIPAVQSKYPIDIYGRLEFNASYDDSRTNQGNYNRWVDPENNNANDDQFNASANRSRIGVKINGPEFDSAETTGLFEGDFFGGGEEHKAQFRMRHAFMQLHYPEQDLTFLAGQTYDIISPLIPPTLNFTTGYWVGNLGFRRPQFRISKGWHTQDGSAFTVTGGFSRTIGEISGFDPGDTGEDAGFPTLQGHIAYSAPLWMDDPFVIGISGHWGQEEYDINVFGNNRDLDTWSANVDVTLPLTEKMAFTSEAWIGENLDTYVGGINQGINTLTLDEISAYGGWSALTFGPYHDWTFNIGATLDDPDDEDLPSGGRTQNLSYFTNSIWQMNDALQVGLELSYWETDFINNDNGDAYRIQTSMKYKF